MRSARAALTAELACNAPSTAIDPIVARASSGVTSFAMLASGQSQYTDMEQLAGGTHRLQIFTAKMPQAELHFFSGYRLLDRVSMSFELIPDGGANEVGAVRIKPLLNHQIDVTEIDMTEVDRDLLAIRGLRS
jgi:hypothetical protein